MGGWCPSDEGNVGRAAVAHVGAVLGEFEFQRYRTRPGLAKALRTCDVIQVVSGSPAWANAVCGLGKPVSLQVATRAQVERRQRDSRSKGLAAWWRRRMTGVADRLDDKALRRVDAIQVENLWMLEYARAINGGRMVDIRYAPPGIDTRVFHPITPRELSLDPLHPVRWPPERPAQEHRVAARGYARLKQDTRDTVRLVLAGSSGRQTRSGGEPLS